MRQFGVMALVLLGCRLSVDPSQARFSCSTGDDCGAGYSCRPQFAGGGLCYRVGECAEAESCDGADNTCDGRADEGFDLTQDQRHCGQCGRSCAVGTTCRASSCEETSCDDLLDNDGDGDTDCWDTTCYGRACSSNLPWRCGVLGPGGDGGVDAGQDAGFDGGRPGCYAPEESCANGADDDGDGLADCLDDDCDGRVCLSGTTCAVRQCPGPG